MRAAIILVIMLFVPPGMHHASGARGTSRLVVHSPDGNLRAELIPGQKGSIIVTYGDRQVFSILEPRMVFRDKTLTERIRSAGITSVDRVQIPLVKEKRAKVADRYNELTVVFRSDYGLILRAYDDGFAYRFLTRFREDSVIVVNETGSVHFSEGDSLYLPVIRCRDEAGVDCFHTSFEEDYIHRSPSGLGPDALAYLPLYARTENGFSIAMTESDLRDYPGMFVSGSTGEKQSLALRFPAYPLEVSVRGDPFRQELVTRRADFIAKTEGSRNYPWRVFIMGEQDGDLVNSDMVYRLAPDCRIEDTGWIKPGKITDEWITNAILYGVDFRSGINSQTYKYYVDFAHRFGLSYIFLDAGWSDINDLTKLNPDVDLPGILAYAREKNVGVWLWTCANTIKNQMECLKQFSSWGIRGIMVDFMDREDQAMIRFQEYMARETAANRLMLLFHGASKPAGLRKAYPNVIIREGVMGHEFDKWSDRLTPEHNLIIPFTRMIAGPMDYEGGGMINAQMNAFRIVDPAPMTQGTRIHQLAMYVVYESPLQYLAGNISDYLKEPEYAAFYGKIPVEWDETLVLDGRISDYILVARRSGSDWWVGAMTDWTPRTLEMDLSFLGNGLFKAKIYKDGTNADLYAADYQAEELAIKSSNRITLRLAPGGGWVGYFSPTSPPQNPHR